MVAWNMEQERYYLGNIRETRVGYAADPGIRNGAASGGLVSALLIHLLESGAIDGALVSRCIVKNSDLASETFVARTRSEILSCRTSIYFDFDPLDARTFDEIAGFDGRIAVVGLPCNLRKLSRARAGDDALDQKIALTIGLFCGHNSKKELIHRVLAKKEIDLADVAAFSFRKGLWRGRTRITLKNGSEISFPFQHFSVYHNGHILAADKCRACRDLTAELADVSTGDIWTPRAKKESIKHSVFIGRTEAGCAALASASGEGVIVADDVDSKAVFRANNRALTYHKAIRARAMAAALFNKTLKVPADARKARWNEFLAALALYAVQALASGEKGKELIFRLPRRVVWLYLAFFKLMMQF